MSWQSRLDVDALTAIDVHTHVHRSVRASSGEGLDGMLESMSDYFGSGGVTGSTVPEIAAYYRERRMACVVFGVDSAAEGDEMVPTNEEVAELAAENADVLIPFASIDPARGASEVRAARRLIEEYGVPQLVQYANSLLRDKVLFGSDYPVITPERWLSDFEKISIKPPVRPLILKDNAVKLFGLGSTDSRAAAP